VVLYRFESALVFFNAPYFKKRVLKVAASRPGIRWFVVDGGPINIIDSTGASMLQALGVTFARAGSASASPTPAPRCGLLERRETSAEAGYPLS
jgi:MFS superfamily sulfate permease-like transporter